MTQIPNEVNVIEGRVVHKKVERVASFSKTCGRAICRRVQGENDKAEKRLGVTDGFGGIRTRERYSPSRWVERLTGFGPSDGLTARLRGRTLSRIA
jgi:hypothetical protein